MTRISALALYLGLGVMHPASAQDVRITPELPKAEFTISGKALLIERVQRSENRLAGEFAKTSRACPPFCIQPMQAVEGVETVGELELISFLQTVGAEGTGLLIDARVPEWFSKGSIPGAVNVPFSTLAADNPFRNEILKALGAREAAGVWDFADAMDLMIYCNGPWCEQAPKALKNLADAGYPLDKLHYYRGGMQSWLSLGLTVERG